MTFRDDRDAQRERIASLERALEDAQEERDRVAAERDRIAAERDRIAAERAAAPVDPAGITYRAGDRVHVEWRGSWWPGKILEAVGPGAWRVTYEGWSSAWDESVGRERLRPRHVRPPGPIARGGRGVVRLLFAAGVVLVAALVATSLASSPTSEGDAPPGAVVSGAISPGRALWVEWSGSWYPAIALEPYGDGSVRVHYEGYSDSYDETVSPDRVRLR